MSTNRWKDHLTAMAAVLVLLVGPTALAQGPTPGQNVNMVSGTRWPGGDPFLQRQNEPSIAVSTRNPLHLLAGANDYRTVDLPTSDVLPAEEAGDAWLGLFKSFDGGASWQSTLIPGFPQDQSAAGLASPMKGFTAGSDPVVRAGSNGMFYYSGIAFNRATNIGGLFLSRFIDLNNKENGDATRYPDLPSDQIRYISTVKIDSGNAGQFIDKPWMAVDIPRANALTCNISVTQSDGTVVNQTFSGGNVYLAYAMFVGGSINVRSKVKFVKSSDCGVTWTKPIMLSQTYDINQGISIAIDPATGYLYVAWRVFDSSNDLDTIVVAKSTDGGNTFTRGAPVISLSPYTAANPAAASFFDEGTTPTRFRTNSYPVIAVDGGGLVYLAWSQRLGGANNDARIMLTTSPDGANWAAPAPVAAGPIIDDIGDAYLRGHQFMPSIAISGGKVMLVYYDLRLDHTLGLYTPSNPPLQPDPNHGGRLYTEDRQPQGELSAPNVGPAVFTPFVDDSGLTQRRHTLDVMLVQANPGSNPVFGAPVRVSQYIFGLRGDVQNPTDLQQLQENPPNLPLFGMGTEPFFGDYIDIAGLSMVPASVAQGASTTTSASSASGWIFNTAANPTQVPVFYTTWTTNQDVRPPLDGNWQHYTPVGAGGTSVFDPKQIRPTCVPGQEGMRNQNIYSSQVTQGLLVSSPQLMKPLSPTLQRAFVLMVQNLTNFDKTFHLTIANQPQLADGSQDPNGFASFVAGVNVNNPGATPSVIPPAPVVTVLDVDIPPQSGMTRPVFAVSSNAIASIKLTVTETTPAPGVNNGLASFVVFNPDPTSPLQLVTPDGVSGQNISTVEIYSPSTSDPALYNPNAPNPNAPNPNGPNTGLSNPNAPNPNAPNPNAPNPNAPNPNAPNPNAPNPDLNNPNAPNPNAPNSVLANPNAPNPNAPNPNAPNPNAPNTNITNTSVFDAIYTATNAGNTSASYRVKLVGNNPGNIPLQLAVNKTYQTPTSSSYVTPTGQISCQLTTENHTSVQALINNPPIFSPTNLTDPGIQDPSSGNATFSLRPGESALVVLRAYFANYGDPSVAFSVFKTLITQVVPVVASQAANTNDPTNTIPVSGPLLITTMALPQATVGQKYDGQLIAVGGNPGPLNWALFPGAAPLPPGLQLSSQGAITGVPTTEGIFSFTVQVTDSGPQTHTSSTPLTISVARSASSPLTVTTTSLPQATVGSPYGATLQAAGGTGTVTWVITQGALPPGLFLNGQTGLLSGAPTSAFVAPFTVQATDSLGNIASRQLAIGFGTAQTLTVTNTNDSGAGSLRQAILDANDASPGSQPITIIFNIPTEGGVVTIAPLSALPALTTPVILDATTQFGYAGAPVVDLNGANAEGSNGLHISAGNSAVRGLAINGFGGDGILLDTNGGDVIQGNYVGTDAIGITPQGNANGIHIVATRNNVIGGTTNFAGNVISGNIGEGVRIDGTLATANVVQGNFIGTDATGSVEVGNHASGIYIRRAPANSILGNTVSGNLGFAGITICGNSVFCGGGDIAGIDETSNAAANIVQSNIVGATAAGTGVLGNSNAGLSIDGSPNNVVGGATIAVRNILSFNNTNGVQIFSAGANGNKIQGNTIRSSPANEAKTVGISVQAGTGNTLSQNSISGHNGLGIDLPPNGQVNLNQPGGAQNFPVITSAQLANGTTTIAGTLNSAANATFTVEFFSSLACNVSGFGEGSVFLGSTNITTDAAGNGSFDFAVAGPAAGSFITTTATDANGTTSEFSECFAVTSSASQSPSILNLTPATVGILTPGQSFNETRAADVTVLTNGPLTVSAMVLNGLSIGDATSAQVGARIYNLAGTLLASANANVTAGGRVSIPIAATLIPGNTYRIGFYVQTNPANGGSATVLVVTSATLESFPAYTEPSGRLKIVAASDSSPAGDVFPTSRSVALPQMTIAVSP